MAALPMPQPPTSASLSAAETGILLGMALFAFTAALTFASASVIVQCSAQFQAHSYSDLVHMHFGRRGAAALQLSIIAHVFGVMVG